MVIQRKYAACAVSLIVFGTADISLTTVLFARGKEFRLAFLRDVYMYTFSSSLFDIWVMALLRSAVILGMWMGFMCKPSASVIRLKQFKALAAVLAVIMWTYNVVKMLALTESETVARDPWYWGLFSWTGVGCVGFYVLWICLGNLKLADCTSDLIVNVSDEERTPLLRNENSTKEKGSEAKGKTNEEEKKKPSTVKTVLRLLSYSRKDWLILLTAFIFMTIASVAQIFQPFYTGQVISGIAIEKSQKLFVRAIIIMSLLSLGSSIAAGIRGGFFKLAIARHNIRVRNHLFRVLVQQEIGFFDNTKTGEMTSRLTSDTATMSDALSLNTNIFLRTLIQAIGTCVFMFKLSWRLSMVTVVGLPIVLGVSHLYGEYYKELAKKVQDVLAKANDIAEEACSSMRTVRSFANELAETKRYTDKLHGAYYSLKKKEAVAYAGFMWCSELFFLSLVVATLYYGGVMVVQGTLSGGNLLSFILYQMELGFCLESMSSVFTGLMQAVGASEKVFEYIDRKPKIQHETGKLAPACLDGRLEFKNVAFSYPSRPDTQVLKDVSFTVEPGEVVALVGPSGGGKSTCVSLLERFYETSGGQVLLDSFPVQDYDHKYLHQKVTLVGQEPVLYARSIQENIAYGLEEWDLNMVQYAAQLANAHSFISDMKDKYDTEAGEKGVLLSGGQKQRVAIARALIRNPAVLILDEATSALDAESEHLVQQAIYKNLSGRTVIIVAHRLSTVEKANRIIVIDKGSIVEQGTHQELLQNGSMYARLVQRQLLGFDLQPKDSSKTNTESCSVSQSSFKSVNSNEEGLDIRSSVSALSSSPKFGSV